MLKHLDLFSGIGGFALACQWNGIETIGFVEIDKYCQKVLRKHWPNVPIVEDIRDVEKIKAIANTTEQSQREPDNKGNTKPINRCSWAVSRSRGTTIDTGFPVIESPALLITAGFPCQPFSVAGKREGDRDDRYLWPQTLAVIKAVKPEWVLLENVTGIINLALDTVLSDLEGAGYSWETLIIPACAVNAWHRRDRIWIVANHTNNRFPWSRIPIPKRRPKQKDIDASGEGQDVALSQSRKSREQTEPEGRENSGRGSQEVIVADTQREGLEGANTEGDLCRTGQLGEYGQGERQADWWAVEPELGRVAHGIPHRVDRLKCLGNAIVPQVAYGIIKVMAGIEANIPDRMDKSVKLT